MAENDPSAPVPPEDSSGEELHGLDPAELLARGLNTVRFSGTFGQWVPPEPEALARLIPQYHIESILGHGGMGAVYKGFQADLDRPVAIKLLPAELSSDEQFVSRFKREARTLARLHHPGIVAVYDFGQTTHGHLYFVMEYIDGTDLRRILKSPGLNPEQALELVGQICEALQAAHKQGVIHRDIKPANILLTADGTVKLADFGLSRPVLEEDTGGITLSHQVMGTADYMSPEQRSGHSDHRTDIYALGVTLYEMLTGKCPHGVFVPPSRKVQVDVRIDEVVIKALQEEPDLRYQQASEMKSDVDHIRTSAILPVQPPATGSRKSLVGVALLALLLAICGGAYVYFKNNAHPVPAAPPQIAAVPTPGANTATPSPAVPPATPASSGNAANIAAAATPTAETAHPAQPNPTSAEQALTSYLWSVSTDTGNPMTILYYPDGTGRGPRTFAPRVWKWQWMATGQRTFNLNGNTACVFDENFTKFIGYWTDQQNHGHATTGVRLPTGVIHFISATYECGPDHRFDVTDEVLSILRTGQRQVQARDDLFGDPLPGKWKSFIVVLSSDSGEFKIGGWGGETLTIPEKLPATADSSPLPPPVVENQPAPSAPANPSGLILDYDFSHVPNASNIADRSGMTNNGLGTGIELVRDDERGVVAKFGLTDSYITVPNNASLNPPRVTLTAWIKTSYTDRVWRRIFDKGNKEGYVLSMCGDDLGRSFRGQCAVEPGKATAFSGVNVADGQWHQVVGTFDGSAAMVYVDGQAVGGLGYWRGDVARTRYDLTIGANRSNPIPAMGEVNASFNGLMGRLMIFNRALTAAEVQAVFDAQKVPTAAPAPTGTPVPAGVTPAQDSGIRQALVSSWWRIQSDDGESKMKFLPDGTVQSAGVGKWEVTGPLSFTINGQTACVFDESFSKFIGHFSDGRGLHRVTGRRVESSTEPAPGASPAAAVAPAGGLNPTTVREALVSYFWRDQIDSSGKSWTQQFFSDGTAKGAILSHWVSTGSKTFTINDDHLYIFDNTFSEYTGHWTDRTGQHTIIGIRLAPVSGSGAIVANTEPAAPTPADAIQPGSVWQGGNFTLTILERHGETFRGRFEAPNDFIREVAGVVKDNKISWLAKDVSSIRGGSGGDNFGTINGDRIDFFWHDVTGRSGNFPLVQGHPATSVGESAPAPQPVTPPIARLAEQAPAGGEDPVIGQWRWAGTKAILTFQPDGTATDRRHGKWVCITPESSPRTYQINWGRHLDTVSLVNNGTELAGQNEVNFKLHLLRVRPPNTPAPIMADTVTPQQPPLQQPPAPQPFPTPGAMSLLSASTEAPIHLAASGPSGTNFGWGTRDLKLDVSLTSKLDTPTPVTVDCYWVGFDGRAHTTALSDHRNGSVSSAHPITFEINTLALRTDGMSRGIIADGVPRGPYRGWIVAIHDKDGKRIACSSNMPEFQHLVP